MDTLSVILPVHNEVLSVEKVIQEWKKTLDRQKISYKLIIAEDGSKDGTKELLSKIKNKYSLILNQKEKRRGYGGAVIDGINAANSKYILSIDSDGQCDPKDFSKFWENRNRAQIIIGWMVNRADKMERIIYSSLFKRLFLLIFPTKIHDPSAPYVLYKKNDIQPYLTYLSYLREGFWWGFVGLCVKKKITLLELEIQHQKRLDGETQVYQINKIPSIALRNIVGLCRLRLAK